MRTHIVGNPVASRSRTMVRFGISFLLLGLLCVSAHGAMRVVCIGDSITQGTGVKDQKTESYPAQLGQMLGHGWRVDNRGMRGATMLKNGGNPYWHNNFLQKVQRQPGNIVVLMLGTNDSKPENWKHKDEFAKDYEAMINVLRGMPDKPKVYVVLPVPAYPGRWGIRDKVIKDEIIPLIQEVAKKTGVEVIDAYTPLSGKPELFPDTVHPNAEGAKLIAQTVANALLNKEKEQEVAP